MAAILKTARLAGVLIAAAAFPAAAQMSVTTLGAGMAVDGLVVRPISFVGTVLGSIVFVATLPFSALGGNVDEAADLLVLEPAKFTFSRCLGCWPERY